MFESELNKIKDFESKYGKYYKIDKSTGELKKGLAADEDTADFKSMLYFFINNFKEDIEQVNVYKNKINSKLLKSKIEYYINFKSDILDLYNKIDIKSDKISGPLADKIKKIIISKKYQEEAYSYLTKETLKNMDNLLDGSEYKNIKNKVSSMSDNETVSDMKKLINRIDGALKKKKYDVACYVYDQLLYYYKTVSNTIKENYFPY